MKWLEKNILILIIIALFSLWMWEKNRGVGEMKPCEGMTSQQCEAWYGIEGNKDRGW